MNRLTFSYQSEAVDQATHIGAYSCPYCEQKVEFRTQHFSKHEGRLNSNLQGGWPERFDKARPLQPEKWESFLDFHCPRCGAPVGIIYEAGSEWAMGCHPWHVTEVVEAKQWEW